MPHEPEYVFPDQEHPSDVEIWLEDGAVVRMRVGSFGPTVELSPDEARQLGLAFQELADRPSTAVALERRPGVPPRSRSASAP